MRKKQHPKKSPSKDWHPAEVVAALRLAGWSLSRLSLHHGYKDRNTLKIALHRRWPKGERHIAKVLGRAPAEIWPSRYPDGASQCTTEVLKEAG